MSSSANGSAKACTPVYFNDSTALARGFCRYGQAANSWVRGQAATHVRHGRPSVDGRKQPGQNPLPHCRRPDKQAAHSQLPRSAHPTQWDGNSVSRIRARTLAAHLDCNTNFSSRISANVQGQNVRLTAMRPRRRANLRYSLPGSPSISGKTAAVPHRSGFRSAASAPRPAPPFPRCSEQRSRPTILWS